MQRKRQKIPLTIISICTASTVIILGIAFSGACSSIAFTAGNAWGSLNIDFCHHETR